MPIEFTPPRRLLNAFLRLRERQRGADGGPNMGPKLTAETVEASNTDGSYQVKGVRVGTTGKAQLEPGQGVTVAWKQGTPEVIVAHEVQRAQFPQLPVPGEPGVEMLLAGPTAAGDVSGTKLDVWFRNQDQTTLLNVRAKLTAAGFTITSGSLELRAWGLDQRRFCVTFVNQSNNHPIAAVFRLNHERTRITATARVSLEKTYDVGASGIALGTMTWSQVSPSPLTLSTPLSLGTLVTTGYTVLTPSSALAQTAGGSVYDAVITKDRHLVIAVNCHIVDQDGSLAGFGTVNFDYSFLIDMTAGAVLFNGIASQGVWPGGVYDGAHFINNGVGAFDITSPSSKIGGTRVTMVPTKAGNVRRVVGVGRAIALPTSPSASELKWVVALIIGGPVVSIFQVTFSGAVFGSTNPTISLLSWNHRHVMWMRTAPSGIPPASLSSYNFQEGVHITDLGAGEALAVADAVVLSDRDSVIALMDETPYLVRPRLLWIGRNDLRTVEPAGAATLASLLVAAGLTGVSAGPRRKTKFVSYTTQEGFPKVPIAPPASGFPLSLTLATGAPTVADLKPIPTKAAFLAVDVLDKYQVSGHQDPVVGAGTYVNFRSRVQYMTPAGD